MKKFKVGVVDLKYPKNGVFVLQEEGFQTGDIVEAFGCKGIVTEVSYQTVYVNLDDELENRKMPWTFQLDGRIEKYHKEPSLKLIERPVKEVTFESIVHNDIYGHRIYHDEMEAFTGKEVIVTVKLKG